MLQHTRCATANYTLKCSSNTRDTEQGGLKHQHHTYQDNWYLRTLTKKFSKHQMSGNVLCWNITHEHFIVQKLYMKLPVLTLRYKAYWACYLQFPCVQQIFKVFYVTKGNFTADKHMHTHWPPLKNFKNKLTLCSALFLEKGITGAGWGHGVGLCQIGAAVMAEKGYGYRAILAHYYKNTELVTYYDMREPEIE